MNDPEQPARSQIAPSWLDRDAETLAGHLLEPATIRAVYDECRILLGARPTVEAVIEATQRATEIAETVWRDLETEGPAYACKKGCAWCCHQTVMVTAPEVFVVDRHLRATQDADSIRHLAERLKVQAANIAGRSTAERMGGAVACGLLEAGACSVHPARPMPCRGGFSQDAAFCEALFDDHAATVGAVSAGSREGPFLLVPKTIFNSAQVGLVTALRDLGFACHPLELTAAMAIALSRDDLVAAWLADESVFAAAELRIVAGNYVTSAVPRSL